MQLSRDMSLKEQEKYYSALYRLQSNSDFKVYIEHMILDRVSLQQALETETDNRKMGWVQGAAQYIKNNLGQIKDAETTLVQIKTNKDGG